MNFCTKVLCTVVLGLAAIPMVKADELVIHTVAAHTGDYDYNNDTFGLGIKSKGVTVGAYKHSYTKEGALKGIAAYVSKPIVSKDTSIVDMDLSLAVTYGYPERLKGNYEGFMVIPTLNTSVKLTDGWSVIVTTVPGKLVGNDNAYMLSFSRKF